MHPLSRAGGRVLMIGLDGFEPSLADRWMEEGELPHLAAVRERSARYLLDHGRDKYSGLAWEHVCSGLAPSDGGRNSAVTFHAPSYGVRQDPTTTRPFMADLSVPVVVFDTPYCDIERAPQLRGITNWGAHDPGVATASRPDELLDELHDRFGPYPAPEWIYGMAWPSPTRTEAMSDALVRAVEVRTEASRWLLAERLPDWRLAMVVVAESHSGIEGLWHGVDPGHPLNAIASAAPAASGLRRLYKAIDDLVGDLSRAFPDTTIMLFSMHGMGPNQADAASMALLPELMYRHSFKKPYMRPVAWPDHLADGTPLLDETLGWSKAMRRAVPLPGSSGRLRRLLGKLAGRSRHGEGDSADPHHSPQLHWMPAARYRGFWRDMEAFALPSFYDGRIRINLRCREGQGKVALEDYHEICRRIVDLLHDCRECRTGEPVVDTIHWGEKDPMTVGPWEADLYVVWRGAPLGLASAALGTIGPIPYNRTGGHTGTHGFLQIMGDSVAPGDHGVASSFDVVPTVLDLLGQGSLQPISGRSRMAELMSPA